MKAMRLGKASKSLNFLLYLINKEARYMHALLFYDFC